MKLQIDGVDICEIDEYSGEMLKSLAANAEFAFCDPVQVQVRETDSYQIPYGESWNLYQQASVQRFTASLEISFNSREISKGTLDKRFEVNWYANLD